MREDPLIIFTIGHSTRSIEEFLDLMKLYEVKTVVDIRTIPRSRHVPQFNLETLPDTLKTAGINYVHIKDLGGLRHSLKNSPNTAWRNASFRGFADYMQTPQFEEGLRELRDLAEKSRIVVMCAEMLPWRCHRSLVADALVIRGIEVKHIFDKEKATFHKLTPWARVDGCHVTYPERSARTLRGNDIEVQS